MSFTLAPNFRRYGATFIPSVETVSAVNTYSNPQISTTYADTSSGNFVSLISGPATSLSKTVNVFGTNTFSFRPNIGNYQLTAAGSPYTFIFNADSGSWLSVDVSGTPMQDRVFKYVGGDKQTPFLGYSLASAVFVPSDGSASFDLVFAGATRAGSGRGTVIVYARGFNTSINAPVYTQFAVLTPGTATGDALFGSSIAVSVDGRHVFVGGAGDQNARGATWYFVYSEITRSYEEKQKIIIDGGSTTSFEGQGIAVACNSDATWLAVGAPVANNRVGYVGIFQRDTSLNTLMQQTVVTGAAFGGTTPEIGRSVALSSDGLTLAIGGPLDEDGFSNLAGATWIFVRNATTGVWSQQGAKLVGTGYVGDSKQGTSVSLSSDGDIVSIGGNNDDSGNGAVWIFTRTAGVWTQQGAKLTGAGATAASGQGISTLLTTNNGGFPRLIFGAWLHNALTGTIFVFDSNGMAWTQVGGPLELSVTGGGQLTFSGLGWSLAVVNNATELITGAVLFATGGGALAQFSLSGSFSQLGNEVIRYSTNTFTPPINSLQGVNLDITPSGDYFVINGRLYPQKAWIFSRSGSTYSVEYQFNVPNAYNETGTTSSVAISANGNVVIIGDWTNNSNIGRVFVYTRDFDVFGTYLGTWTLMQELTPVGAIGNPRFGIDISINNDATILAVGGYDDNAGDGAVWVFMRASSDILFDAGTKLTGTVVGSCGVSVDLSASGTTLAAGVPGSFGGIGGVLIFVFDGSSWSQQGAALSGTGNAGNSAQGRSVSLTSSGDMLAVGGNDDNAKTGATWIFTRSAGVWTQLGSKLVGSGSGAAEQGISVSLSANGTRLAVGGSKYVNSEGLDLGKAWLFSYAAGIFTETTSYQPTRYSVSLVSSDFGKVSFGESVVLSANAETLLVGGPADLDLTGAVWAF